MFETKSERKELKRLKKEAHDLCDMIWGDMHSQFGQPHYQYEWLQYNTRTGHIGTLNKFELQILIKKLRKLAIKYVRTSEKNWWK